MWMIIATKIRRRVISLGCHTLLLRRTYFEEFKVDSQKINLEIDVRRSSVRSTMDGTTAQSSILCVLLKKNDKKNFLMVNYAYKNPIQMRSSEDILCGRLIDRCIRPLFSEGMTMKIQVCPVINRNWKNGRDDTLVLANIASSTALMISDIPWARPIGAVKIGRIDGNLLINPTIDQQHASDINFLYACTTEKTLMIDLQGSEISEIDLAIIINFAHQEAIKCIVSQVKISNTYGKEKNCKLFTEVSKNIYGRVYNDILGSFRKVYCQHVGKKFEISSALYQCTKKWIAYFTKLKDASSMTRPEFREACD